MKTFYEYIEHLDQNQNLQEVGFAQLAGLGAAAGLGLAGQPDLNKPATNVKPITKASEHESKLHIAPTLDDFKAEAKVLGAKIIQHYNEGVENKITSIIEANSRMEGDGLEKYGEAAELMTKTTIDFGAEQKIRFASLISSDAFVTMYYISRLENFRHNTSFRIRRKYIDNLEKILNSVKDSEQRLIRKLYWLTQNPRNAEEYAEELIFSFNLRLSSQDNFDINKNVVEKKVKNLPASFLRDIEEIKQDFADSDETNRSTFYLPKNLSPEFVQELRAIKNQLPAVMREISRLPITMEDFKDGPRAR
jgi:hypothetical protein